METHREREVGGHLVSASGPEENSQTLKEVLNAQGWAQGTIGGWPPAWEKPGVQGTLDLV